MPRRLGWTARSARRRRTGLTGGALLTLATLGAPGCSDEESVEGSSASLGPGPDDGASDGPGPEPETCDGGCQSPPSDCHDSGTCEDGFCHYPTKLAGEVCHDGCVGGGFCDASGNCLCTSNPCEAECTAGPNATAHCDESGECIRACESPFENCDGDWSNGCEVPVGVTGVCNLGGLDDDGCWTAYCGSSDAPDAHDFGTYYCVSCSTCNTPSNGMCRWCNRETGSWYPAESCSCSAEHLDFACEP
jgi:hypothetical protein